MTENHFDIIIIGSGLGSLLCGYILSREGMRVCILEKNKEPGGALQTFRRKGIEFDTGVHYIGGMDEGQNLNRYFKYFGLSDNLKLRRLNKDRFDVIAFDDGEYPFAQDFDNFIEQLLTYFPGRKHALQSYVNQLEEISNCFPLYNLEIPKGEHSEDTFRRQSAFKYYNSLISNIQYPASSIQHPVSLSSVLAGNNFLYAGNKETTPLHIPALINHSFISSAWRLVGGSRQIAELLVKSIISFGGIFRVNSKVGRIHRHNSGFNVILKTEEQFTSDRLIAGIHPVRILEMTDPSLFRKAYSARIRNMANTPGSFAIYIIFKENSFKYLDNNYYYHRTKNVWYDPGTGLWPSGYMLHTPAFEETGNFAKSLIIMTYMDYGDVEKWENSDTGKRDASYYEFKMQKANRLLDLAEMKFPGLRSKISFMETSTPLTWRDFTGTPGGSMYGIQKDFSNPSGTVVFPNTKIPGFFFTGQNVNLHGVLGVTIGSVMTCSEILGYDYLLNKISNA
jgi:all-trans-retinol 13,14-reductase